jgi:hypothetical protein
MQESLVSGNECSGRRAPWRAALELHAEEATDSIKTPLGCDGRDGVADDLRLLFAASKAEPSTRHWGPAPRPHVRWCRCSLPSAVGTYHHKVWVPQIAMMQLNLLRMQHVLAGAHQARHNGFRHASICKHGVCVRQASLTAAGASTRRTGNSPQAQSALQALHADGLHYVLWGDADHEAPSMNLQNMANMVWLLVTLGMSPADNLRNMLWAAAECEVPSMSPQNVADTVWALATLAMPPKGSMCDPLLAGTGC